MSGKVAIAVLALGSATGTRAEALTVERAVEIALERNVDLASRRHRRNRGRVWPVVGRPGGGARDDLVQREGWRRGLPSRGDVL